MTPPPIPPNSLDLDPEVLWIMHCAEGPVPLAAARAVESFLIRETKPWALRWEEDFLGLPDTVRHQGGQLFGVEAQDLTLTATTSTGLVSLAQAFPWNTGDEVLAPRGEFPSNAWPWLALAPRGITFRQASLWPGQLAGAKAWESPPPPPDVDPENSLLEALAPQTRVLSASWVRFQDGLVLDLHRLGIACQERDITLVVDGIQGAGTLKPNLTAVDAFVAGGHKGLLAPQGLALLWTAPDFRNRLHPVGTWLAVEDATDFERPSTDFERPWLEDGRCLEQGVPNLMGCAALVESLALLNRAKGEGIDQHLAGLRRRLLTGLNDIAHWRSEAQRLLALDGASRLGSLVALHHGNAGKESLGHLLASGFERGIYASMREGYLRLAFHGWHQDKDVDRVLNWLEETPL